MSTLTEAQSAVAGDLAHLAPALIVASWSLLLLVADAFSTSGQRTFQRRVALVGVALALMACGYQMGQSPYDGGVEVFSGFLVVDQFVLFVDFAILGIAGLVIAFAGEFSRHRRFEYGEQEPLVLISAFGAMVLAHASDLLALFLGIETMSIAAYVLVGARWNSKASPEAALKYFLMGAFASGLMLMGIALLYGATGVTHLGDLGAAIPRVFHDWRSVQMHVDLVLHPEMAPASAVSMSTQEVLSGLGPVALLFPGMLLLLGALLFKISAVPFHMWTPDVYEGAPTPITAWMAAGVKLGGFAALLKVFVGVFHQRILIVEPYGWTSVVALVAFATMTVGNFAALGQRRVKRLLAFSSVAHVGYLLVGVVTAASFYGDAASRVSDLAHDEVGRWAMASGDTAISAVLFYIAVYAVATLGCFAAVAYWGDNHVDVEEVDHWAGMAQRHPQVALGMTICLLSLLGMPPLAGFVGKLSLFHSALANDNVVLRWLVVAALLNAVLGAYYYLRLIMVMYFREPPRQEVPVMPGWGAKGVVTVAAILSIALGLGADSLLARSEIAASGFAFRPGSSMRQTWTQRDGNAVADPQPGSPVPSAENPATEQPSRKPAGAAPSGQIPAAATAP